VLSNYNQRGVEENKRGEKGCNILVTLDGENEMRMIDLG
jgi:hypothetical protein